MKKLLLPLLLGITAVSAPVARAADVNDAFTVTLNLTPACIIQTGLTNITLNYTAFSGSAVSNTETLGVRCSTGLAYTLSLNSNAGAGAGFGSQTAGTNTGLNYTINADTTSGTGNGLTTVNHVITASAAAGQAGTGGSDVVNHTIYVVY